MPGKRQRNQQQNGRSRSSKRQKRSQPGWGSMVYSGVPRPPGTNSNRDMCEIRLTSTATVPADGSGIISLGINDDPSGYTDWSTFAGLFTQYRALAWTIHYVPLLPKGGNVTNGPQRSAPMITSFDPSGTATIPATYTAAYNYGGSMAFRSDKSWTRTFRYAGMPDSQWRPVTAPTTSTQFFICAQNEQISVITGDIFVELLIQFNTRQ